jgi:hypothetical protein
MTRPPGTYLVDGVLYRAGRRLWTSAEDALLRAQYADTPTEQLAKTLGRPLSSTYQRAAVLGLEKSESYLKSPAACRLRRGDNVGQQYRFKPGQAPANKGTRRPGWHAGRMRETWFAKGERRGVAVALYKPVGSERICKDGYLERKTHDEISAGVSRQEANRLRQRRWRAVHLILWEEANGPIPRGHAVVFTNGDRRDIRLDNLTLITRAELMRRNTIHNLPTPLKQTVRLLSSVNREIRKREDSGKKQN